MTTEDIGIDLDLDLPTCAACRKKSDGAKRCQDGTILCGTHYDDFLRASRLTDSAAEYAKKMREGPFRACWEAVPS